MLQKNKIDQLEALKRLQKYCGLQERAPYDAENKLKQWGFPLEKRKQIITELIEQDFLNEGRYAKAYVSGKFKMNKWGRLKIKNGLYQKFVSEQNIEQALACITESSYNAQAKKLITKYVHIHKLQINDWEHQRKIIRFTSQKGYETGLILSLLKQM